MVVFASVKIRINKRKGVEILLNGLIVLGVFSFFGLVATIWWAAVNFLNGENKTAWWLVAAACVALSLLVGSIVAYYGLTIEFARLGILATIPPS